MPIFPQAQRAVGGIFDRINRAAGTPAFGLGIGLLSGSPQAGFQNAALAAQMQQEQQRYAQQQAMAQQQAAAQAQQQGVENQFRERSLGLQEQGLTPSAVREAIFATGGDEVAARKFVESNSASKREAAARAFTAQQNDLNRKNTMDVALAKLTTGAPGSKGKFTEAQLKFATFANIAQQNQNNLGALQSGPGFDPTVIKPDVLNTVRTPQAQEYTASKRAFIDAIIRPMTGAAVTKQEFDSADKRYFPQFGDSPKTVQEKAKLRQQAVDSIKAGSNGAFEAIFDEAPAQSGVTRLRFDPATGELVPSQ